MEPHVTVPAAAAAASDDDEESLTCFGHWAGSTSLEISARGRLFVRRLAGGSGIVRPSQHFPLPRTAAGGGRGEIGGISLVQIRRLRELHISGSKCKAALQRQNIKSYVQTTARIGINVNNKYLQARLEMHPSRASVTRAFVCFVISHCHSVWLSRGARFDIIASAQQSV